MILASSIPNVIPSEDECENFLKSVHHVLTEILYMHLHMRTMRKTLYCYIDSNNMVVYPICEPHTVALY